MRFFSWLLIVLTLFAFAAPARAAGVPKTGCWGSADSCFSSGDAACAAYWTKNTITTGLIKTINATTVQCRHKSANGLQTYDDIYVYFQYFCPTLYPVTGPDGLCWKVTPVQCKDGSYADFASMCPADPPPPSTTSTSTTTTGASTGTGTSSGSSSGGTTTSTGDPTGTGTSSTTGSTSSTSSTTGTSSGSTTGTSSGSTTGTSSGSSTGSTTTSGGSTTTTGATTTTTGGTTSSTGTTSTGSMPTGNATSTGATGTPDSSNLCKQNPSLNICQNSTVSGDCAATTCTGDAITCAILQDQRKANCEAKAANAHSDLATAILNGADPEASNLPSLDKATVVDLSSQSAAPAPWLGGSCFTDQSFVLMNQTLVIPFSKLCDGLIAFRGLVMLLAGMASFKMVSRSVLSA